MACQSQEDDYHYRFYCYDNKNKEEENGGTVLDWNLDCSFGEEEIGVGGAMESPVGWWDCSTGYLEDAVVEWADDRCKRRRVEVDSFSDVLKEFWNWNNSFSDDHFSDFDSFSNPEASSILGSDPSDNSTSIKKRVNRKDMNDELQIFPPLPSSSSSSCCSSQENTARRMSVPASRPNSDVNTEEKEEEEKRKNKQDVTIGVIYPFTVVRSGGFEGVVTIDDINRMMLRRPTRPIRHPVGEFRCLPCTSASTGVGISGKAVVGLTRIHTVGRGTITIIRTRG